MVGEPEAPPVAFERSTLNVSSGSFFVSLLIVMLIVFDVEPGLNVSVVVLAWT